MAIQCCMCRKSPRMIGVWKDDARFWCRKCYATQREYLAGHVNVYGDPTITPQVMRERYGVRK